MAAAARTARIKDDPSRGIWKRFLLLVPLVVVLAVTCWVYVHANGSTYSIRGTLPDLAGGESTTDAASFSPANVTLDRTGVIEVTSARLTPDGDHARIELRALGDGEATVNVARREGDTTLGPTPRRVRVIDGVITCEGHGFAGWESLHVSLCVFMGAVAALFLSALVRLRREAWFGYTMVSCAGGLLFFSFQLAFFVFLAFDGGITSLADLVATLTQTADWFVAATIVPVTALALLVSLSNVWLIAREGLRPVNMLGVAVSVVWGLALLVLTFAHDALYELRASFEFIWVFRTCEAVAVAYGECLLFATVVCAWLAARHRPRRGGDYLVILGCGLRADGTPCPLLAGRIDAALALDAERQKAGDAPATFVPSGGQGPDEPMSEAESMAAYLREHGIPDERIVLEGRSTTTRENMAFSREAIEAHAGVSVEERSVLFSTTNYHVFRGYVCAHEAGMRVEGVGSRTRAYFWPNAFLREFAGLLVAQWRMILQVYLVIAVVYAAAAIVYISG